MSKLADATKPVDTAKLTPAETPVGGAPALPGSVQPGQSPFLRCPIPPTGAGPDSLRQFYSGGIPQFRVMPPPAATVVGAQGPKGEAGASVSSPPAIITTSKSAAPKRETISLTTGSLASNAQETGTVPLGKTFSLMQVNVSGPCRVRLYSNTDFRDADIASGRALVAPSAFTEHGIIADMVFKDNWSFSATGFATWRDADAMHAYSPVKTEGAIPIPGWTFVWQGPCPAVGSAVKMDAGLQRYATGSAFFSDHAWYSTSSDWAAAGYPEGGNLGSLGSIYRSALQTSPMTHDYGDPVLVPPGAVSIIYKYNIAVSFGGGMGIQLASSTSVSTSFVNWVCSPEAPGSDCSTYPTGDIACCIDNLLPISSPVTANFTILREEK